MSTLCYALLKILLKEIIDEEDRFNKVLCSYYMKTVLFWILEDVENLEWTRANLLRCLSSCIQRLHYFIMYKYIPNYFIPEHNMIEGRYPIEILHQLEAFLAKLNGNIYETILKTSSLASLLHTSFDVTKQIPEFDQTFLTMSIPEYTPSQPLVKRSLQFFVHRILKENFSKYIKEIYTITLLDTNRLIATSVKMHSPESKSQENRNKRYYLK